jgi:5-methylcytosine-specific restriction protein A
MPTYLLTWNPEKWNWKDLAKESKSVKEGKGKKGRWSCGNTKKIIKGDRFFLLKQGKLLPKGIFASGFITKSVFEELHWNEDSANKGKSTLYVGIKFDTLLNPDTDEILDRDLLIRDEVFSKVNWNTQGSGIEIKPEIALELEEVWQNFSKEKDFSFSEEIEEINSFYEGAIKQITVNAYERNTEARRKCIEHYGTDCFICGFNFGKTYGEVVEGFIHVHHLYPLSEIGETYKINPVKDLRPVCPNCHAVIHKNRSAYSIEAVKEFVENHRK